MTFVAIVSLATWVSNKEYKVLKKKVTPNFVYLSLSLGVIVVVCAILPFVKKYTVLIDLLIPIYGLFSLVICAPTWYEHPYHPKRVTGATLL